MFISWKIVNTTQGNRGADKRGVSHGLGHGVGYGLVCSLPVVRFLKRNTTLVRVERVRWHKLLLLDCLIIFKSSTLVRLGREFFKTVSINLDIIISIYFMIKSVSRNIPYYAFDDSTVRIHLLGIVLRRSRIQDLGICQV